MEKVRSSKINVSWNDMGIFMILALLIVILSVIRPVFLTPDNIINVIRQVTIVAIIGIGMSFVLISGEIDLSVGSICALSGIIVTMCLRDGFGMTVSILLALCTAAFAGQSTGQSMCLQNPVFYRDHGHAERCQGHCPCHYQFLFHHRAP